MKKEEENEILQYHFNKNLDLLKYHYGIDEAKFKESCFELARFFADNKQEKLAEWIWAQMGIDALQTQNQTIMPISSSDEDKLYGALTTLYAFAMKMEVHGYSEKASIFKGLCNDIDTFIKKHCMTEK